MPELTTDALRFRSANLDADRFRVWGFSGEERLGRPFRYEIDLLSEDARIDPDDVMGGAAALTVHPGLLYPQNATWSKNPPAGADAIPIHGIVSQFEQRQRVGGTTFYRAVLVPRLWRLSLDRQNRVFLDKSVIEIAEELLKAYGLNAPADYSFLFGAQAGAGNTPTYPKREYACQYEESSLAFLHRLLEREGLYYFFAHEQGRDILVFTDHQVHHPDAKPGIVRYGADENLEDGPAVRTFEARRGRVPGAALLRDFDTQAQPGVGNDQISTLGQYPLVNAGRSVSGGDTAATDYRYGDHLHDMTEGKRLAAVAAEERAAARDVFTGSSTAPYLRAGHAFTLFDHYRQKAVTLADADYWTTPPALPDAGEGDFPWTYLCIALRQEARQPLPADLAASVPNATSALFYRNSFEAIDAAVQYRPPREAHRPKIAGMLNAVVDASASAGDYAELDAQGRYKIRLPFDTSGREAGKASHWVRLARPYAGNRHGLHFPLHKGTEVLLAFEDGDPDRPVIVGALHNPLTPDTVGAGTSSMGGFVTAGGNIFAVEDKKGEEHFFMKAGDKKGSYIICGTGAAGTGPGSRIEFQADHVGSAGSLGDGVFSSFGLGTILSPLTNSFGVEPWSCPIATAVIGGVVAIGNNVLDQKTDLKAEAGEWASTRIKDPLSYLIMIPSVAVVVLAGIWFKKKYLEKVTTWFKSTALYASNWGSMEKMQQLATGGAANPAIHLYRLGKWKISSMDTNIKGSDIVVSTDCGHIMLHAEKDVHLVAGDGFRAVSEKAFIAGNKELCLTTVGSNQFLLMSQSGGKEVELCNEDKPVWIRGGESTVRGTTKARLEAAKKMNASDAEAYLEFKPNGDGVLEAKKELDLRITGGQGNRARLRTDNAALGMTNAGAIRLENKNDKAGRVKVGGDLTLKSDMKKVLVDGAQGVVLKSGGASVNLNAAGINALKGSLIKMG